jgi:hypothetical protein
MKLLDILDPAGLIGGGGLFRGGGPFGAARGANGDPFLAEAMRRASLGGSFDAGRFTAELAAHPNGYTPNVGPTVQRLTAISTQVRRSKNHR